MFVRISSYKFDSSRAEEADARNEDIAAVLKGVPGLLHAFSARDDRGEGVVVGVWESEQDANEADAKVAEAWSKVKDVLTGPPQRKAYPHGFQLK